MLRFGNGLVCKIGVGKGSCPKAGFYMNLKVYEKLKKNEKKLWEHTPNKPLFI